MSTDNERERIEQLAKQWNEALWAVPESAREAATPLATIGNRLLAALREGADAAPRNQCDGCARGLQLRDGIHYDEWGGASIGCSTACSRPASPPPGRGSPWTASPAQRFAP